MALADVTLSIIPGEFVAIIGPSGPGKSTLLQILGLLDRPSGGEYRFQAKDVSRFSDDDLARLRNESVGFIFQSFNLLARTTVLANVILPLSYSNVPEREWKARAEARLSAVGLAHRLLHEPSQLSGGEKQRVAIARALVTEPDIIFADEPTGNLDSVSGRAVMDILNTLHRDDGKTIILITHDIALAREADRIIRIVDGRIVWDGQAKEYRPNI